MATVSFKKFSYKPLVTPCAVIDFGQYKNLVNDLLFDATKPSPYWSPHWVGITSRKHLCPELWRTVYPKKYAHGFVVLCFVVVMQSFIMNSYEVFIHIHQGCFAGTGAIVRLPQCQWSKPHGYGKISQCITPTKHIKAKTVCIFLGIYCMLCMVQWSPYESLLFALTTYHRASRGLYLLNQEKLNYMTFPTLCIFVQQSSFQIQTTCLFS